MTTVDITKTKLHPQPENPMRDPRLNVEINVGKACNNRCVFCLDGMPKKEDRSYMDFELMTTFFIFSYNINSPKQQYP